MSIIEINDFCSEIVRNFLHQNIFQYFLIRNCIVVVVILKKSQLNYKTECYDS